MTLQRLGGVAVKARDPEAAAAFAAERLGFNRAGGGPGGSQMLVGHGGPDPIDLVYVPGDAPGMDHVTFVASDVSGLAAALAAAGVEHEASDAKVAFHTPAGHRFHVVVGPTTPVPAAALAPVPATAPAPICADHLGLGAADFEAEVAFCTDVLGMLASNHVVSPDGVEVMTFLRFPGRYLYHQLVIARTPGPAVHHLQFTMKNLDSFYAAHAALQRNGVAVQWGPLRHGPGHNVAMYVQDAEGYWLEFSVEEEIIMDDAHYAPRTWSVTDPKVIDEWNSGPPPEALMGAPA